jgi:thiol:disulfide interchange protein
MTGMSQTDQDQNAPAVQPAARSRSVAIVFAVAAVAVLIFGLSFMVTNQQAGAVETGDISEISMMGERVNVVRNLAPGKYTIIDFYADWCINCTKITPKLENLTRRRSDVALRKINIVHWGTPVVAQYEVEFLPYLQMYGPSGALVADGADAVLAEVERRFPSSSY